MPRRVFSPEGHVDDGLRPVLDHIRQGTREQYESDWTLIVATHSVQFQHDLGEVPWVVHVIRSIADDGKFAAPAPATDHTVAYTDSDGKSGSGDSYLTVTNDSTDTNYYFKVRAM